MPVKQLRTGAKEMDLGDAKVFHLPDWNKLSHPQRLAVLRQIAMMRARDPRIAKLAVSIFKASAKYLSTVLMPTRLTRPSVTIR